MTVADILQRIDTALDHGDFETLATCLPQLEAAARDVPADAAALRLLRARAVRLAARLDAAAEGVRAARWRLSEIRSMGRNGDRLVTYDGQGQRQDTGAGGLLARRL